MKSYKIYIDTPTWDCEANIVDTSRIHRYMKKNGHKNIDDPSKADYIIINSCAYIKNQEQKSVNLFTKYNSLKKKNATIIMYGCIVRINPKLIETLDTYPIPSKEGHRLDKISFV